jgi:uncharacterized RDD family membrane protein YckC
VSHAEDRPGRPSRIVPGRAREVATRVHGEPAVAPHVPDYQGLVTRAIAFSIDAALINFAAIALGVAVGLALSILEIPSSVQDALLALGGVSYFVWTVAYFAVFWSSTGQTPGGRLLHIRVVDADDGRVLRPRRAVLRLGCLTLAALPLLAGFLTILVDDRRRGLHDMLAGTVVVAADPVRPLEPPS